MDRKSVDIILSSDRVLAGEKPNQAGERAREIFESHSMTVRAVEVIPEGLGPSKRHCKKP